MQVLRISIQRIGRIFLKVGTNRSLNKRAVSLSSSSRCKTFLWFECRSMLHLRLMMYLEFFTY